MSRIALLACLAATMLLLHSSSQQGATGCKVMPCEFLVSNIVMCLFLKKVVETIRTIVVPDFCTSDDLCPRGQNCDLQQYK